MSSHMKKCPTLAALMTLLLVVLLLTADAARVPQHISTATAVAAISPADGLTAADTLPGRALLAKKKKNCDWKKWLDISVNVNKDKSGSVKVGPININWGPK